MACRRPRGARGSRCLVYDASPTGPAHRHWLCESGSECVCGDFTEAWRELPRCCAGTSTGHHEARRHALGQAAIQWASECERELRMIEGGGDRVTVTSGRTFIPPKRCFRGSAPRLRRALSVTWTAVCGYFDRGSWRVAGRPPLRCLPLRGDQRASRPRIRTRPGRTSLHMRGRFQSYVWVIPGVSAPDSHRVRGDFRDGADELKRWLTVNCGGLPAISPVFDGKCACPCSPIHRYLTATSDVGQWPPTLVQRTPPCTQPRLTPCFRRSTLAHERWTRAQPAADGNAPEAHVRPVAEDFESLLGHQGRREARRASAGDGTRIPQPGTGLHRALDFGAEFPPVRAAKSRFRAAAGNIFTLSSHGRIFGGNHRCLPPDVRPTQAAHRTLVASVAIAECQPSPAAGP